MTEQQPNLYYQSVVDELRDIANDENEPIELRQWARRMADNMDNGAIMEGLNAQAAVETLMNMNLRGSADKWDVMGLPPDEIDDLAS